MRPEVLAMDATAKRKAREVPGAKERIALEKKSPEAKAKRKVYRARPEVQAKTKVYNATKNGIPRIRSPERHLKRTYGITQAVKDRRQRQQFGCCAICGKPPEPGKKLHVDHDHATGEVRGLLCDLCNRGLGFFKDNPQALRNAARYLEEPAFKYLGEYLPSVADLVDAINNKASA
jgi:hypothetical protein